MHPTWDMSSLKHLSAYPLAWYKKEPQLRAWGLLQAWAVSNNNHEAQYMAIFPLHLPSRLRVLVLDVSTIDELLVNT